MSKIMEKISPKGNDFLMLIGGKWVSAKEKVEVKNPFTGEVVGTVPKATPEQAEQAAMAAVKAREAIKKLNANDRYKVLMKAVEIMEKKKGEVAELIVLESGKPISGVKGEVHATIERMRYAADEARNITGEIIPDDNWADSKGRVGLVFRKPLGSVLAISPFNYPLFSAAAKVVAAIAAGNTVVLKPATDDPLCALYLAAVLEEAGLPSGVLNVITGSGKELGDILVPHKAFNFVSFTGSSPVGEWIAKNCGMKRMELELGGKCPALVLEDADLDVAAKQCVTGALKLSGQRCDSVSRVLVNGKVADAFVAKVMEEVKNWNMGDPLDKATMICPLINENAVKKVEGLVEDAKAKGAKVLAGGKRGKGLFYEPTVLDNVNRDMKIAWEETFGPVVTIIRVKSDDEALGMANESVFGLDASVFTKDLAKAIRFGMALEEGIAHINAAPSHGVGKLPFGGEKASGIAREGVRRTIYTMMEEHTIALNL